MTGRGDSSAAQSPPAGVRVGSSAGERGGGNGFVSSQPPSDGFGVGWSGAFDIVRPLGRCEAGRASRTTRRLSHPPPITRSRRIGPDGALGSPPLWRLPIVVGPGVRFAESATL